MGLEWEEIKFSGLDINFKMPTLFLSNIPRELSKMYASVSLSLKYNTYCLIGLM